MNILTEKRFVLWSAASLWCCLSMLAALPAAAQEVASDEISGAREAMRRAATFYRTQVAQRGGYVYPYDLDLQRRWGEGEATRDQIWVQPPGTPTVGLAYLAAYDATGEALYLEAATAAAEALCYGQLESGGWTNCIDFNPDGDRVALYRNGLGGGKNNSSLDDGQTQAALRFLMMADAVHRFQHAAIHQAVELGLRALLNAQFECGAFPQVWNDAEPHSRSFSSERRGNFPTLDWRSEGKIKEYWTLYTLNDGLAESVSETLRTAHQVYGDARYLRAWERLGDFLIQAQMPEPQPAWAQQYNFDMQPVWARKFEPPAITGRESQGVLQVLMDLYRETGKEKYLQPVPAALDYLRRSQLSDGRLARYYELQTNRPLYMQRRGDDYLLTYDDTDLPDHYGWQVESDLPALQARYDTLRLARVASAEPLQPATNDFRQIMALVQALDGSGRWVSQSQGERLVGQKVFPIGTLYLSSAIFSQNLTRLAEFIQRESVND